MHHIKTAYTAKTSAGEAAAQLKAQLGDFDTTVLIYFASSAYDHAQLSAAMHSEFGQAKLFGCSTSGEIISGQMLKNALVAMAFNTNALSDISVQVVENISRTDGVEGALGAFETHFGEKMAEMDFREYVGIILIDGLSRAEERIMDRIGDLTNVTFIGGSAGDDLKFKQTHVHADGKVYTNAAVLALLKPAVPFDFIKTQSFKPLGKTLTVTQADEAVREVLEFDGKPAVQAYAEALGETVDSIADRFMKNPVGLMVGDSPFVRSPQQISGDRMVFYCNVKEGMDLMLLESTDMISETRAAVEAKAKEMGGISGILNFHCILRTLDLEKRGQTEDYGKIFSDIPTVGFSTYGEEYIGHINQTATMLVFK